MLIYIIYTVCSFFHFFKCTHGSTDRTKNPLHPGPCLHCLNDASHDDDNDSLHGACHGACFFPFPLDCVHVRSSNFYAAR